MSLPNVIILGVGHSGTRVLVDIMRELGWNTGPTDEHSENLEVVSINTKNIYTHGNYFDVDRVKYFIKDLKEPWVLKDPRFVRFNILEKWTSILDPKPFVLHLERDAKDILISHQRRNEEISISEIYFYQVKAKEIYKNYQYGKHSIKFEDMIRIAENFNIKRAKNGN